MHIEQEEYTMEYIKEKMLSYVILENFFFTLPFLTEFEFDFLLTLVFS